MLESISAHLEECFAPLHAPDTALQQESSLLLLPEQAPPHVHPESSLQCQQSALTPFQGRAVLCHHDTAAVGYLLEI